ncbi:MFS transporter [Streptomyces chiangmaiensis]|uniref:MFS transporter n=1 Tax=Streptomyces chiangmaiensis TaxID=766497 RepID=A0ABU7FEG0_9ACTN|nr:MFS transporter [Streptomyces chiangmaiensis]MED7822361.1 MFS transporter [Streptomyces chiangmaiensis]
MVLCLGVMMTFVNVSSTISALSPLQDDLHISASTLVWVSSAFSLAVVSLVLSAGTLSDLLGRRRVFWAGVLLFTLGSFIAFLAGNAGLLIAAQALMGVGAAAVLPSSLAIVSHTFADPHERTGAISIWASCAGLGLAIGPLAAGVLLDQVSWHAVFLTDVVIGLITLILTPLLVSESKHPTRRFDPAGMVLGTLAVASATYAIIEGGATGYGKPVIIASYVVFAVSLVAFVRVELRHRDPMLELRLFKNASFTTVMSIGAVTMLAFVGISLLTVLYLERVAHENALMTGVKLLPMFATYIVVSAFAARLVQRLGIAATLTTGLALMGVGAFALLAAGPFSGYGAMWPGLFVAGVGSALLVAPSTAAAVNSVPPLEAGMAAASVNMFRQLGSVLGPSVLGTLVTTRFPRLLHDRLASAGVPAGRVDDVIAGITRGGTSRPQASLAHAVSAAYPQAFTDALHLGWLVAGIVSLAMTVPTALFLRRRRPVA